MLRKEFSKMASQRIVHFVRHAESKFNEIHHKTYVAPTELSLIDADLSPQGELQAKQAKEKISKLDIELAITSPFARAISTCLLSHGENNLLISPLCGERFESVCDIGTSKEDLAKKYPKWDFSGIENNIWWYTGGKNLSDLEAAIEWWQSDEYCLESDQILKKRADKFYELLQSRPEKSIAVFSHSQFLRKFLRWYFDLNVHIKNAEIISLPLPVNI